LAKNSEIEMSRCLRAMSTAVALFLAGVAAGLRPAGFERPRFTGFAFERVVFLATRLRGPRVAAADRVPPLFAAGRFAAFLGIEPHPRARTPDGSRLRGPGQASSWIRSL
jgi:hypothetical protein